jgi:hypothetical protein
MPQPSWESAGKLWSLWDMLRVKAEHYVEAAHNLAVMQEVSRRLSEIRPGAKVTAEEFQHTPLAGNLVALRSECEALQLRLTTKHIDRCLNLPALTSEQVVIFAGEIYTRFRDELAAQFVYSIRAERSECYEEPLKGWATVTERFGCSFDVEEARKCIALERYTAAAFHLLKVVEIAVHELQIFLQAPDVKPHFGSVLARLDDLTQKTKYEHVPPHLQPYVHFMKDMVTQLHEVKDSWRDKVSDVDARIVPIDTFTEELVKDLHDATLQLMKRLKDGLPAKVIVRTLPRQS